MSQGGIIYTCIVGEGEGVLSTNNGMLIAISKYIFDNVGAFGPQPHCSRAPGLR